MSLRKTDTKVGELILNIGTEEDIQAAFQAGEISENSLSLIFDTGGSSRYIGKIVQSTVPISDAGLHLLDGSLISGSGSYAAFVTYIAGLVSTYPNLFETETNWQQAVTTYGVCGKYVYDSTNNTVRLPKYSDKFWSGGGTANAKGNGMTLGLTDGTNTAGLNGDSSYGLVPKSGLYGTNVGTTSSGSDIGSNKGLGITTDPTKSGIITDLSTITTALDGYWYICIATTTKTNIEVDIDEIATDLNGKLDKDGINASSDALHNMGGAKIMVVSQPVLQQDNILYLVPES